MERGAGVGQSLGMAPQPQYTRTFIRQWRKSRGLTLEQLAELVEMVPSHLSMLERGQRGYVQETLEAIARALKTDVGSLLSHGPDDTDGDLRSIWQGGTPTQRRQIVEIAKTITKSD